MHKGSLREAIGGFVRRHSRTIAIALIVLLLFSLLTGISLKTVLLIPVLILAASFSTFYFNYVSLPVNVELVKLATIVVATTHGFFPGLMVGVAATFFGKVLIGRIDEKLPLSMLMIAGLALGASLFAGVSITTLGITLVMAYNVAMLALSMMMGGDLAWNLPYEGTNFLFNIFLFANIAPLLKTIVR